MKARWDMPSLALNGYDSTMFYTKGASYSLLAARVDQEHLAVAYLPFPAANLHRIIQLTRGEDEQFLRDYIYSDNI